MRNAHGAWMQQRTCPGQRRGWNVIVMGSALDMSHPAPSLLRLLSRLSERTGLHHSVLPDLASSRHIPQSFIL